MLAAIKIDLFLLWREQIEQKRSQSGFVERARNELIPRTMPAAATAVNKKYQRRRLIDNRQISIKRRPAGGNADFVCRKTGVKIVTESFRFRPINHADRAFEPRTVKRADHFLANIAEVDPKSIQSGFVK